MIDYYKTTVYLEKDQKEIIQKLFCQEFSKKVRLLADALIKGVNLKDLPAAVAEDIIQSRILADKREKHENEMEILKNDFFNLLDRVNYPLIIAKHPERFAKRAGREFARRYYFETQKLIPECYIFPFVNEYYKVAQYSGKVQKARIKLEQNNPVNEIESAEAI